MYFKKIGAAWRKKDRRLGVLTFFRQALSSTAIPSRYLTKYLCGRHEETRFLMSAKLFPALYHVLLSVLSHVNSRPWLRWIVLAF